MLMVNSRQLLRVIAVHLALAAMTLRALLPAGWMPDSNPDRTSLLTICSIAGPVAPGKAPAKSAHEVCPFAAAAHSAVVADAARISLPGAHASTSNLPENLPDEYPAALNVAEARAPPRLV